LDYLTTHTSLSPIWRGFAPGFVNYKKGCTRLAATSNKVYHLLAHGQWFSPATPASSTIKTGRHDIAVILLKMALITKNQSKSIITIETKEVSRIGYNKFCFLHWYSSRKRNLLYPIRATSFVSIVMYIIHRDISLSISTCCYDDI
jgi:hypothetical protein